MRECSSGNPGRRQTCCPLSLRRRKATMTCFISSVIARCWTRALPRACTKTTAATSRITPLPTVFPTALHRRFFAAKPRPACAPWPATGRMRGAGPDRESLFTVISKDINSFDIETELSPVDLRMLRASLCARTTSATSCSCPAGHAAWRTTPKRPAGCCRRPPRSFARFPAWFPVQVVERCPQACSYCPYPVFGGDPARASGVMPRGDDSRRSLDRIEAFAGEAVVGISLWGEPSLHPVIRGARSRTLSRIPGIDLVVETSGVGWEPGVLQADPRSCSRSRHGSFRWTAPPAPPTPRCAGKDSGGARDGWTAARAVPRNDMGAGGADEGERGGPRGILHESWKTRTANLIIQKYDSFCGTPAGPARWPTCPL